MTRVGRFVYSQKKKTGNVDNQVKISKTCVCVIQAVVAAMAAHKASATVQKQLCRVLRTFAGNASRAC
jgi:hypothetical protein